MNTQAVQNEINSIIEANHSRIGGRAARNQYRIGKAQENTLRELGILDLVPNAPYCKYIGHSDAKAVIEAAQDAGGKVYVSNYDDVSKSAASNLYTLLHAISVEVIDEDDEDILAFHAAYDKLARLENEIEEREYQAWLKAECEANDRNQDCVDQNGYYI